MNENNSFYFTENLEYLKSLLSPLVPSECNSMINGWGYRGQLLWDYMLITDEIEALLAGSPDSVNVGYKLELLQPQLSLLCAKINQFPCPTAKHRYEMIFCLVFVHLSSSISR